MATIPPAYERAFQRWGYLADAEAHKYGLPNGATLLAKIGYVETRFSSKLGITSSAGAQGPMQFMPTTRAEWIEKYGLDPWKSVDEAVHSGGIFMKTLGLDSYNPGSSTYISEVLKAPVSVSAQATGAKATAGRPNRARAQGAVAAAASTDDGDSLIRFLLTAAMGLGGAALVGVGISRAVGSSPVPAGGA